MKAQDVIDALKEYLESNAHEHGTRRDHNDDWSGLYNGCTAHDEGQYCCLEKPEVMQHVLDVIDKLREKEESV